VLQQFVCMLASKLHDALRWTEPELLVGSVDVATVSQKAPWPAVALSDTALEPECTTFWMLAPAGLSLSRVPQARHGSSPLQDDLGMLVS
jgi:hypothetical protein